MADPFLGEIRLMPYSYAPLGWAYCDGALLAVQQNTALFSIIGSTYGGNGQTNFMLPDLRGKVVIGWGQGPSLANRQYGESGGAATVTLTQNQVPPHNHKLMASGGGTAGASPSGGWAGSTRGAGPYLGSGTQVQLGTGPLGPVGGGGAHTNMMPTMKLNYCIALQGIYPPRS